MTQIIDAFADCAGFLIMGTYWAGFIAAVALVLGVTSFALFEVAIGAVVG